MSIIKLKPAFKDYLWGGTRLKNIYGKESSLKIVAESWELSCHKDGQCIIAEGVYEGKTLQEYIKEAGKEVLGKNCERFEEFPILIKLIDAKNPLSIQVHPDDNYALKNEGQYGKTEVWYVADCEEGASLYYGFKEEIGEQEFQERISNGTLTDVLYKATVQKGDVFFIEPGTIHAIGADIVIAEIQQSSNVTYRVYDYGRKDQDGNERELHVDKALDVTSLKAANNYQERENNIAKCEYFSVDKISLKEEAYSEENKDSFVAVLVLEGKCEIKADSNTVTAIKGETLFIDAGQPYTITGTVECLLTTVPKEGE